MTNGNGEEDASTEPTIPAAAAAPAAALEEGAEGRIFVDTRRRDVEGDEDEELEEEVDPPGGVSERGWGVFRCRLRVAAAAAVVVLLLLSPSSLLL